MAMKAEIRIPQKISWSVFQNFSRISVLTLRRVRKLWPQSPLTKPLSQRQYWVVSGLSRPIRARSRGTACGSRLARRCAVGSVVDRTATKTSIDARSITGIE